MSRYGYGKTPPPQKHIAHVLAAARGEPVTMPGVAVTCGLDHLLESKTALLRGRRIGLLAHPASIDSQLNHAVDRLLDHPDINLTAIFGPQHGARGETQDNMIEWEDYRDPLNGLPVFSLYGRTRRPTREMLQDIDILVVDLQDVGARYYTFIYTLAYAMQACGEAGKSVIVLDRPNPINGIQVEGPVLDPAFSSFVGLYPLPVRHGMTVGELACYFNEVIGIGCDLSVVDMRGWRRGMYFEETGLPWVPPSPNMPAIGTAVVYPGMCLFEGTNVSEGRGTTLPFEFSGAPEIEPNDLIESVSPLALEGVRLRPIHFIPTFHKWCGHLIGGVHLQVFDRAAFRSFSSGLALLQAYRQVWGPAFQWKQPPYEYEDELLPFDILCGTDGIRRHLEAGGDAGKLEREWKEQVVEFSEIRERFLRYED